MAVRAARSVEPVAGLAELFEHVRRTLPGDGTAGLARLRAERFERFRTTGFPTTRVEQWKYTNVARHANLAMALAPQVDVGIERITPHLLGGPRARRLIFVNGHIQPQLSHVSGLPAGVTVMSLQRALAERPDEVVARVAGLDDGSSFTDLNAALMAGGAWIDVPDGVAVEEPLQLLFLTVGQPGAVMIHPRILLRLGAAARLKVIESHAGLGEGHALTNLVTQLELGPEAQLIHDRLQLIGDGRTLIGKLDAGLARGATLRQTVATIGGALVRNETAARIIGRGVECLLNGVYMPTGQEHVDTLIRIDHEAPAAHSDQYYKGVVDGHSRAVFAGKIFVHRPAQQTNAFQANNNLLLSDDAEIDTKPELEIYADDVKCSHGATVGELDEQALFYLRSRGVERATAESILIYGFAGEVFERFGDASVRKAAHRAACARLPGGAVLEDML